jgi:hypothetical protein
MGQADGGVAGLTMPDYAQFGLLADCGGLMAAGLRVTRSLGRPVDAGARADPLAWAGEVLVTSTVQLLVVGSGIGFARLGHSLTHVPDRWQLFVLEQT